MSIKCSKCLRVKPERFFTESPSEDDICDFCQNGIDEQANKRSEEIRRSVDCENRFPIMTGYAETDTARSKQQVRNDTFDILEARRIKKELENYE